MIYFFDIDDTICYYKDEDRKLLDYSKAIPYSDRINKVNKLYEQGHTIVYWTARGSLSNINWFTITLEQLKSWGCKFHELRMNKPVYDFFIDDKNISSHVYFQ
jgi:hypothetical protein